MFVIVRKIGTIIKAIMNRILMGINLSLNFLKVDDIPLKWKILFMKGLFINKSRFCHEFYNILQDYQRDDHYNFKSLKVTFFPFQTSHKKTFAEYFVQDFLDLIFPAIFSARIKHPLLYIEDYYFDDKNIFIKPTDIVLDCGGFIGHFAIGAAKKARVGKVFVFEPFQENIDLLLKNVNQNKLKNVKIIQKAVCNGNKELNFVFNKDYPSSSSISKGEIKGDSRIIQCTTIDQIYKEFNIKKVDFIKMDIEGMERDALKGAKEVISKFKPKLSLCTYHLPDDPIILPKLIKQIRSDYIIKMKIGKLYAY